MNVKAPRKSGAKGDSYYGKVASNYEQRRSKQKRWHVEQDEMQSLLQSLDKGISVVDVPFGTGRFVPFYHEQDYDIWGLEISTDMVKSAGEILGDQMKGCKVMIGSATDMPFSDGQFDLLVSTRFLRDIISAADAEVALTEFARVTKSHAIIQLGETTEKGADEPDPDVPLEIQLDAAGNEKLLKKHGFEIVDKRLIKADAGRKAENHLYLLRKT